MNRNSCLIVLHKKVTWHVIPLVLGCIMFEFLFFLHPLCIWNTKFAYLWKKAKLYFKDHERKLLTGSLIGQTPSEPLTSFIYSFDTKSDLCFHKNGEILI